MPVAHSTLDDPSLLQQCALGNAAAFEEVVRRHQAAVFRFVETLGVAGADAEDVLQETFIAAWRGAEGFRGAGSVRSWLFSIARNAARHHRRRKVDEPREMLSLDELALRAGWNEPETAPLVDDDEDAHDRIERAIALLSDDERAVLLLRDIEGLSGEETAATLELSVAGMKSRLHRARLHLAAILKETSNEQA